MDYQPSAACKTSTESPATRHSPTTLRSSRPRRSKRRVNARRLRCRVATSSNYACNFAHKTRKRSKNCGVASDYQLTGNSSTARSTNARNAFRSARSFAILRAARLIKTTRRRCGMSTSKPRLRKPRWKTAKSQLPTTASPSPIHLPAKPDTKTKSSRSTPRALNFSLRVLVLLFIQTTHASSTCTAKK